MLPKQPTRRSSAPDALILVIGSNGRFSRHSASSSGCDFVGRSLYEVFPAAEAASLGALISDALTSGESCAVEYKRQSDGINRLFEALIVPTSAREALWIATDVTQRRNEEHLLRQCADRFRALLESASDGIGLFTPGGSVSYANPAGARILRFDPVGFTAAGVMSMIHPDDRESFRRLMDKVVSTSGESMTICVRAMCGDGQYRRLDVTLTNLLAHPAVEAIVCRYRESDNSQPSLRRLTAQLDYERLRVNDIINSNQCLFFEFWNDPTQPGFLSQSAERLLGYNSAEWQSEPQFWLTIVHPEDRDRVLNAWEAGCSKGRPRIEFRWLTRDGRTVWVDANLLPIRDDSGAAIGVRGVATNVTELRSAESALREHIDACRRAFLHAPQPMLVFDLTTRYILEANNSAVELYGYSPEEFQRMTIEDLRARWGDPSSHRAKSGKVIDAVTCVRPSVLYAGTAAVLIVKSATPKTPPALTLVG